MRLHTNLSYGQVYAALRDMQAAGHITPDVRFMTYESHKSHTHQRAFEIQLGTWEQDSLPAGYRDQNGHVLKVRRFKNTGNYGASSEGMTGENVWSATYHEWGWFMAEIFRLDPAARWGGARHPQYDGADHFHAQTAGRFITEGANS